MKIFNKFSVNSILDLAKKIPEKILYLSVIPTIILFFYTSIMFDFDFYLFDEISAVGDRNFQGSSNSILKELSRDHGIVVVTHAVNRVSRYCDYGYVLDCGKISEKLPIDEAIAIYENIQ